MVVAEFLDMGSDARVENRYHSSSVRRAFRRETVYRNQTTTFMTAHEEEQIPLSKTRRKQAMEDLQALGEALVELSSDRIKKIDLLEDLRDAVGVAKRMTKHDEARRRQMQFIGRLMRGVDVDPIRAALAVARGDAASETAKLHRLERLREDFLADEKVLQEIVSLFPGIDVQHLRSLRRATLKEREQNKPPKSYRAIFRLFRDAEGGGLADGGETVSEGVED